MQVTRDDITIIARLVNDLCGIVLDETKGYLIDNRLSKIAEAAGCKTFSEFYYKTRYANDKNLQNQIIDAITTQETLFFRDTSPFDCLQKKIIPELVQAKMTSGLKRMRIWSAACSTGQEPYSIGMILYELIPDILKWDVTITATDISDAAIKQASRGHYSPHEIQRGMKPELLNKYFSREPNAWKVKDEVRALVTFRRLNLLEPFLGLGPFDIIFCRNVVIYFSPEARKSLFHRISDILTPEGCLFVGSSESLNDLGPQFAPRNFGHSTYYQPNKHAALVPG